MIVERKAQRRLEELLGRFPVVGLLGSRQVGKTTLAREVAKGRDVDVLDLELPSALARLENAELYLRSRQDKLVVIDEVQRRPDLFPILRALVDEDRRPGRFLLLGSASPELLRTGSESLAGRIAYLELHPFDVEEVDGVVSQDDLWWRGGFPDAALAPDDATARDWADAFIRTYLQRDLPALGVQTTEPQMRRMLTILANEAGNTWNTQRMSRNLGLASRTVGHYRDLLEQTFILRVLPPFHRDVGKRLVKSPKTYIRDTGLLHTLLRIADRPALFGHPILGQSFEAFAIECIAARTPDAIDLSFWRTHAGAEIDLVMHRANHVELVVECKFGDRTRPSRGFHSARADLGSPPGFIVHSGTGRWPIDEGVEAIGIRDMMRLVEGL